MGLSFVRLAGRAPDTAPAWFQSLPERVWTDIAGGSAYSGATWQKGSRLADVQYSPYPGGTSFEGIIRAWNTACVDQDTGEYIKACEGGHADYSGNEIYALGLRDAVPEWKLIWSRPNADQGQGSVGAINDPHCVNSDGTPVNHHGYTSVVAGGGRIFKTFSNQGGGNWTTDLFSIQRALLGVGVQTNHWVYHGRSWTSVGDGNREYGPTIYDSVANHLLLGMQYASDNSARRIDVATMLAAGEQSSSGPQCPGSDLYSAGWGTFPSANGWSVFIPNSSPRSWIIGSCNDSGDPADRIGVWSLESQGPISIKNLPAGTLSNIAKCGAVYHAPSRKIILGGVEVGSTCQTLTVPVDPVSASAGSFTSGTITNAGGSISTNQSPFQGTFGQFEMINDMGNGQACLVYHPRLTTSPTYVYKLPTTV